MNKFYPIKTDGMFKAIFANPKNKHLLKYLIERCLETKVDIIEVISPENAKNNVNEKGKILDVLVKADDKIIDIEINNGYYKHLHNRNASYLFNKYSMMTKKGESYADMGVMVQINFTNDMPKKYPILGKYYVIDPVTNINFVDNIIFFEYNIEKSKKLCYTGNNEYDFAAIMGFNKDELESYAWGDEFLKEIKNEAIRLNNDEEFIEYLSAEEDAKKVQKTLIEEAEENGRILGLEEGATTERKNTAKKMLKEGLDVSLISKITGLAKEEIIALNNNK